ncbi:hypothetical protein EJB05_38334, partial [Eragrostis curvula]
MFTVHQAWGEKDCHDDKIRFKAQCTPFVEKDNSYTTPTRSSSCCQTIRAIDMPCVCRTITPEEEKEISVFKMASLLGPGRRHPQKHMTDKSLTSSHSDLLALEAAEGNNFLRRTKDAVITLQNVLEGKHNTEIEESLNQLGVPKDTFSTTTKSNSVGVPKEIATKPGAILIE